MKDPRWMSVDGLLEAALEREERLREYVVAHTLIEKGVVDFELHAQTVERFKRAADAVEDVIREALAP